MTDTEQQTTSATHVPELRKMVDVVGKTAWTSLTKDNTCWVQVTVVDIKPSYGRYRACVVPMTGTGYCWVAWSSLQFRKPLVREYGDDNETPTES